LLAGCATPPVPPGATLAEVRRAWGEPGATHTLPGGGVALEYATGPWGRTTWMVRGDAAGRVTSAQQVLTEPGLAAFQAGAEGLDPAAVRLALGRPGEVRRLPRQRAEVWAWRYVTNDCLWFEVEFDAQRRVRASGFATDPACDGGNDRE
jgi:hypothetical protein